MQQRQSSICARGKPLCAKLSPTLFLSKIRLHAYILLPHFSVSLFNLSIMFTHYLLPSIFLKYYYIPRVMEIFLILLRVDFIRIILLCVFYVSSIVRGITRSKRIYIFDSIMIYVGQNNNQRVFQLWILI